MAAEGGVSLDGVSGSGPGGRIVAEDVSKKNGIDGGSSRGGPPRRKGCVRTMVWNAELLLLLESLLCLQSTSTPQYGWVVAAIHTFHTAAVDTPTLTQLSTSTVDPQDR
eukprot:53808-Chlamydomonas_euryale.AAC.1